MRKAFFILLRSVLTVYALLLLVLYFAQRSLIYFPSHNAPSGALKPWTVDGKILGCCREVSNPKSVWLVAHGNAGQATDRDYLLSCFEPDASVYVVEYPGYGDRPGRPSAGALNESVAEAYNVLLKKYAALGIGVVGESIGSGASCLLARQATPPGKIVLVVPFDTFTSVAAEHFPILPVRLILSEQWDNVEALKQYQGPVEIYAASSDDVIPPHHARRLAEAVGAKFTLLQGGHNDWASGEVTIRMPESPSPRR